MRLCRVFLIVPLLAACGPPQALVQYVAERHPECLWRVETADSVVALTLDDGPHPALTPQILDVLADFDARATFFVMGRRIEGNEALLRRMMEEGHELGNHLLTATPSILLPDPVFALRLREVDARLRPFGPVRWWRPASGFYDAPMRQAAERLGYRCALGDVYPNDAQNPFPPLLARYILRNVRPGSVIILHDGSAWRQRTVWTLRRILPELRRRGYRVVTLSALTEVAAEEP